MEISSFHASAPKIIIIRYIVPEIWHVTHVIFIYHFGLIFCPCTGQKIKLSKNEKKTGDIIILHVSTKNYD